jgi:hypothetical protein
MVKLNVFSGCTEFGSEVQAFKDRGHQVTTLGIDGDVDIKLDIRDFHTTEHYDFMTLHPPCTEFSIANWRLGKCKDRTPDMSIVEACFRIVSEAKPTFWMIENPRGCLRHFIGRPQYTIRYGDYGHYCQKPTDLWGVLPFFMAYTNNVVRGNGKMSACQTGCRNPAKRALVPYELSLVLCKSIEEACNDEINK